MGEYIEPSAAKWVSEELNKPHDAGWSDYIALPLLPGITHEEILALAWVLLLIRGTVSSEDEGFSWIKDGSSQAFPISDIVGEECTFLRSALEAIQERFQVNGECSDTLQFRNACLETKVSKLKFVLRINC